MSDESENILKSESKLTLNKEKIDILPQQPEVTAIEETREEQPKKSFRKRANTAAIAENKAPIETMLREFKKSCMKSGVLKEVRKREYYEGPSARRKKKDLEAAKKKRKKNKFRFTDN